MLIDKSLELLNKVLFCLGQLVMFLNATKEMKLIQSLPEDTGIIKILR